MTGTGGDHLDACSKRCFLFLARKENNRLSGLRQRVQPPEGEYQESVTDWLKRCQGFTGQTRLFAWSCSGWKTPAALQHPLP